MPAIYFAIKVFKTFNENPLFRFRIIEIGKKVQLPMNNQKLEKLAWQRNVNTREIRLLIVFPGRFDIRGSAVKPLYCFAD